jgi:AraC-like DNA-binding protein
LKSLKPFRQPLKPPAPIDASCGRFRNQRRRALKVDSERCYLTQVFQQVEGLLLYRYQLRLRLARALDLLALYDDLTDLSQELGFSSHSHFSAAFREAYGRSPSEFRQSALSR